MGPACVLRDHGRADADGDDFQGAVAPDIKVLEVKQAELSAIFDDLYARLNPGAAASARREKIARIAPPR